jgi:hypothetical protein
MLLIGNTGSLITVSGAVFTDKFICQRLINAIFLGPCHKPGSRTPFEEGQRQVAQLIRALKRGLETLKKFYETLEPPVVEHYGIPSPYFHSYDDKLANKSYDLIYRERLAPGYAAKAIFRATAVANEEKKEVVVKFTPRYCEAGHTLMAKASLAPALLFCERVDAIGMFVVVMDYVQDDGGQRDELPEKWMEGLKQGLDVLHRADLVFGDLRLPNLLFHDGAIKFIDFDWCGEDGIACYPEDLCDDHGWHSGVKRGGFMRKEHDLHMLRHLLSLKRPPTDDISSGREKLTRRM